MKYGIIILAIPAFILNPFTALKPFYSVRISRGYRALGLKEGKAITWFWIGSHTEYEKFDFQVLVRI